MVTGTAPSQPESLRVPSCQRGTGPSQGCQNARLALHQQPVKLRDNPRRVNVLKNSSVNVFVFCEAFSSSRHRSAPKCALRLSDLSRSASWSACLVSQMYVFQKSCPICLIRTFCKLGCKKSITISNTKRLSSLRVWTCWRKITCTPLLEAARSCANKFSACRNSCNVLCTGRHRLRTPRCPSVLTSPLWRSALSSLRSAGLSIIGTVGWQSRTRCLHLSHTLSENSPKLVLRAVQQQIKQLSLEVRQDTDCWLDDADIS